MTIDTRNRTTLATEKVVKYIATNELSHGDRLPSEADMARMIGVSRNTVREAYITLEQGGILLRRHGVGTIIIRTSLSNAHQSLSRSYPLMIHESGRKATFDYERRVLVPANKEAMLVFGLNEPQRLFCASRVICADGLPAVFHVDYFRPGLVEEDLDWNHFNGDMVDMLERSLGERDFLYQTQIMAEPLTSEIAEYLHLEPGTPEVVLHAVVYSPIDLKPITSTLTYHNSKVFGFTLSGTLKGTGSEYE